MDHVVLTDARSEICGVPLVLTMMDSATRISRFIAVQSQDAKTTAQAIITSWMPIYGVAVDY